MLEGAFEYWENDMRTTIFSVVDDLKIGYDFRNWVFGQYYRIWKNLNLYIQMPEKFTDTIDGFGPKSHPSERARICADEFRKGKRTVNRIGADGIRIKAESYTQERLNEVADKFDELADIIEKSSSEILNIKRK